MPLESNRAQISRRGLLKAGAVATAVPSAIMASAASASAITRYSTIGTGTYEVRTRLRTGYDGLDGIHRDYAFPYNPSFHNLCNDWADTYGSIMRYLTGGRIGPSWYGATGVYNPGASQNSNHRAGNAFDLTAAHQTNYDYIDCNSHHRPGAGAVKNRKYAGLAWAARKHCPEIGIVGSDPSHSNHIHIGRYKNGSSSLLLSHYGRSWDAWLMQYTCKALMGSPIALDGNWGNQTESYYRTLMSRIGLSASGPFSSTTAVRDLAHTLCAKGILGHAV